MGNIERWTIVLDAKTGKPVNIVHEGSVPVPFRNYRAVEVVPASELRGAVDALHQVREQFANGHGGYDDDPVVQIVNAALERIGGQ
jgi:hypothetical protein